MRRHTGDHFPNLSAICFVTAFMAGPLNENQPQSPVQRKRSMVDFGQNIAGEKIAFILVRIAGQNKRLNAHIA